MRNDDHRRWAAAGLTTTTTDRLGRDMPGTWRTASEVSLVNLDVSGRTVPCLQWRATWDANTKRVAAAPDLLDRFSQLGAAGDEDVRLFAEEVGAVALCAEHGAPLGHGTDRSSLNTPCARLGGDNPYVPCEWYRSRARECRAILNIAARLAKSVTGAAEDWAVISPDLAERRDLKLRHWKPEPLTPNEALDTDREVVGEILDSWLQLYDIRLSVEWQDTPHLDYRLASTNVMGAVVISLVLAVARVDGLVVCSNCGRPYSPKRRPRSNQRNYCPDVYCQQAKSRYATRNYDQKRKARS